MPAPGRIKRIGGKFYDTGTSNISFLQLAMDLKKLGRKNYFFMLEIFDPMVVDIDPYAPNLTKEQVSRVVTECTRNMWYYLREVALIPEQGGTAIRYKANRGNIAQAWCILKGIDSWLNLPRRNNCREIQ